MILAGPKIVPLPYAGVSPAFAVWGLSTNFAALPKPGSIHRMPVGIIDYGVPIVDEPMGSDKYVTLPGLRRGLIFDQERFNLESFDGLWTRIEPLSQLIYKPQYAGVFQVWGKRRPGQRRPDAARR